MTESMTSIASGNELSRSAVSATERHRPGPVVLVIVLLLAIVLAAVLYQPWVTTPFDILDFSDFLTILRQNDSFALRVSELTRQYADQGRFNLLNYAFLAWKWSVFGWNEAAWQVARSAQMLCIVVGVYLLLRKLGADRWGSIVGAGLFIVAQTASPAWMRLPMGEPLGFMTALGAGLIATIYQETGRWRVAGAAIAVLLTATILTKEMLIVLVPFVLLIACARNPSGEIERPRLSRRNVWLGSLTTGGMLVAGIPVVIIAVRAPPTAYSGDYGSGVVSLGHFLYSFLSIMLPVRGLFNGEVSLFSQFGNLLFLGVVFSGWLLARSDSGARRRWVPAGLAALSLAAAAAVVYLPLPYFYNYYGLPFVLAPAILVAISITALERRRRIWRWVALGACVVALLQAALDAAHDSRAAIAARKVHRALIDDFAAHSTADSIVVLMRQVPAETWKGRGPTLGRYAKGVLPGQHFPVLVDAPCSAMPALVRSGVERAMLVSSSSQCGSIQGHTRDLRVDYEYIGWPSLKPRRDSIVLSVLGPRVQTR
ncbi:MAG TPA: hypothetical protein VFK04_01895 [Gemmatimonadaceae bacterium]|nr:hypothetical protein [Gemmatimonadaceae bacterium]